MSCRFLLFLLIPLLSLSQTQEKVFSYLDVFDLEYVSDPQISPQGDWIVYRRMGFDIMEDKAVGNLWMIKPDGSQHQKITAREVSESQAIWSPQGDRLAFISATGEGAEIYIYWVASGKLAKISQLPFSPASLRWSPQGTALAFTMNVEKEAPVAAKMPKKPKGAKWAPAPRITDRVYHEGDGRGYINPGFDHVFVIPADGGAVRQLTSGDYHHRGSLSWSVDGQEIFFTANRHEDWEYDFRNSELYSVNVTSQVIKQLTDRPGPDKNPSASPNGKYIAYLGYEDKVQAYQLTRLQLMDVDGNNKRVLSQELDRDISNIIWAADSKGLYFSYDEYGNSKIGYISLTGKVQKVSDNMGGTTLGRPYASGSFSVSDKGSIAFTQTTPQYPSELAVIAPKAKQPSKITDLNGALLGFRTLGEVKEVWYTSSVDQRKLQGWVVYPPKYDPTKKYPFLVENHGGPILNYGDRFSAEMQLFAAAGYVVFYPNPRGSTSYGEEFGNLLYHNYPGEDYNDVMDGVDHCIAMGIAQEDQLFVTGGSAGGIMSTWMIGKNNRFKAAAVIKPVINWISKTLVADNYFGYAHARLPGQPWENFEEYWKFSPLSLVGNIETPTMVMVGMDDLRTPPSEAKQLYHALKLRKIETILIEIPEASHGIASRPSNLITKVANILAWFEKYNTPRQ
ncbi:Dipeptidyl peptidase IV (DPP IV) N-terminal region [Arenibacter nanhaiticus]|uniref:Dipeptidyl peptidase IV (DPP IV) N-terminal region n=1 Tax=Arenibacter nanhaiticus TaxID=558155 RepID=A0A1M6AKB2_9FLAO|nr:S9 family peptidase [Arenibacter nanhaiticus]SHI36857.1 Dipeptidyl peptidase IV (DPP IV) N-terminal region [Arenibacter nanhaiticus]